MDTLSSTVTATEQDDRIFLMTRVISAIVVPVLLLAFVILYFFLKKQARDLPGRSSRP